MRSEASTRESRVGKEVEDEVSSRWNEYFSEEQAKDGEERRENRELTNETDGVSYTAELIASTALHRVGVRVEVRERGTVLELVSTVAAKQEEFDEGKGNGSVLSSSFLLRLLELKKKNRSPFRTELST